MIGDLVDARHPPADPLSEESDVDSEATGSKERSPRYAQPVPVGAAEPRETEVEGATEDEDIVEEPTYTFAQGYGRLVIRYTRLATALGNFEQGNVQTESSVVAHWLTSGLGIAMSRIGWNLLSPRHTLTRLPSQTLAKYCSHGYPYCREEDRPYHQYGHFAYTSDQWDRLCASLSGDPTFRRKLERRKKALKSKLGAEETTPTTEPRPGTSPLPQEGAAPHRYLVPTTAASLPRRLLRTGGGSKANLCNCNHKQAKCPTVPTSLTKVMALAIVFLLVGQFLSPGVNTIFWLK